MIVTIVTTLSNAVLELPGNGSKRLLFGQETGSGALSISFP